MVGDLVHGGGSSMPANLLVADDQVYFFARGSDGTRALWKSDGTARGTSLVSTLPATAHNFTLGSVNGRIVFAFQDSSNSAQLWSSDGTALGTKRIAELALNVAADDDVLLSFTKIGTHIAIQGGNALWTSDGTSAGTQSLSLPYGTDSDLTRPSLVRSAPVVLNGVFAFTAQRNGFYELWQTDGTSRGTTLVRRFDGGGTGILVKSESLLYFYTVDSNQIGHLWASDGTQAGTVDITQVSGNILQAAPISGGRLVYTVDDGATSRVYITDGTVAGTAPLSNSSTNHAVPMAMISMGDSVFFLSYESLDADGNYQGLRLSKASGSDNSSVLVRAFAIDALVPAATSLAEVDGRAVVTLGRRTFVFDADRQAVVGGTQSQLALSSDGVLRIFGTQNADSIRVYNMPGNADRFVVDLNGVKRSFALADVSRLYIYGYSGDDDIAVLEKYGKFTVRSRIWAGDGSDAIFTGGARDTIFGDAGDDSINGGNNDDQLAGDVGDDSIVSGNGNDTASGDAGADTVFGNKGNDYIGGGDDEGADHLDGGNGADVIFGKAVFEIFFKGKQDDAGDPLDEVLLA